MYTFINEVIWLLNVFQILRHGKSFTLYNEETLNYQDVEDQFGDMIFEDWFLDTYTMQIL